MVSTRKYNASTGSYETVEMTFSVGDRVKLKREFFNEPGHIDKGTQGTIEALTKDSAFFDYFVKLDDDGTNPEITEVNERLGGFPLFEYEIEPV